MLQIHNYSHKPPARISTATDEKRPKEFDLVTARGVKHVESPTLGIELEVEAPKDIIATHGIQVFEEEIRNLNAYVKPDSSLVNGLEIVTHPRTIRSWRESVSLLEELSKKLVKHKWTSYQSGRCGLHVHMGRGSFHGLPHAVRYSSFFGENSLFSLKISGRNKESFERYSFGTKTKMEIVAPALVYENKASLELRRIMARNPYRHATHHSAAPILDNTVEVRIFRGTLNVPKIMSILEFLVSVRDFTGEHGSMPPDAVKYLDWIAKRPGTKLIKTEVLKKFFNADEHKIQRHRREIEEDLKAKPSKPTRKDVMTMQFVVEKNEREIRRLTKAPGIWEINNQSILHPENFEEYTAPTAHYDALEFEMEITRLTGNPIFRIPDPTCQTLAWSVNPWVTTFRAMASAVRMIHPAMRNFIVAVYNPGEATYAFFTKHAEPITRITRAPNGEVHVTARSYGEERVHVLKGVEPPVNPFNPLGGQALRRFTLEWQTTDELTVAE